MNKDSIVQFVRFVSTLEPDDFIENWKPFARLLGSNRESLLLQESTTGKSGPRYSYISQHICSPTDFSFAFMKGRNSTHFPEHKTLVKQAGGYLPVPFQSAYNKKKGNSKIMAFVAHGETDLDFYQQQVFQHLNIYEAYFENCIYSYVMEFFVQQQETPDLLTRLKNRAGVEAALFNECHLFPASKKVSGSLL